MQYVYLCTGGFIKHAIYVFMYRRIHETCNICIYVQKDSYIMQFMHLCTGGFIKHAIYIFMYRMIKKACNKFIHVKDD